MTGEINMVLLELTDQDAALFLEYRRNQDAFSTLVDAGVFNVRNGQAVLSFNERALTRVDLNLTAYKVGLPIALKIEQMS